MYMWSENDSSLQTCQPTTRSYAHRFTKVKSKTSSRVLVLNVGLLPTLQKFRSALTKYASRSSPREFISDNSHIVWCAIALVPTIVGICSFLKLFRKMPETSRKICEDLLCFPRLEIDWKKFLKTFLFSENTCHCVLGLGLEHSCPSSREGLSSEAVHTLGLGFFCVLGLGLEPCVLDSTFVVNYKQNFTKVNNFQQMFCGSIAFKT